MPHFDFTDTPDNPNDNDNNASNTTDDKDLNSVRVTVIQPDAPNGVGDESGVESILINYNERFANADPAAYRDRVIDNTMGCLISKMKPNALLTGPAGVGKTRVVEDIARCIENDDPSVPAALRGHTIYELPLSAIVAGSGIVGQLESKVGALIDFFTDPDNKAILFIDEIHLLVDSAQAHTYGKIAQILKPALARGDLRLISATTTQEATNLDNDPAFKRRFTNVMVAELEQYQAAEIITRAIPSYEKHYEYRIGVEPELAKFIARTADDHISSTLHRPDNALTLLDRSMAAESIALSKLIRDRIVDPAATAKLTRSRVLATAKSMATSDAQLPHVDFAAMKDELSGLIGQENATCRVHTIVRRHHMYNQVHDKPLSMLFPGPSGIGKTETARIISRHMTGMEPIRLNMNEYSTQPDITKITGSTAGYIGSDSKRELPLDPLRSNPYRVLLLDELEKADRSVQHLFLSALDDGHITLSRGDTIDLRKTIIIATTNAAREVAAGNAPRTGFSFASNDSASFRKQNRLHLMRHLEEHFAPEFLGRFSHIEPFNQLDRDDFIQIVNDIYARQREDMINSSGFNAHALPNTLPDHIVDDLADEYYTPKLGARPAAYAVRQLIDDAIDTLNTHDKNTYGPDMVAAADAEARAHAQAKVQVKQPAQIALFDIEQ